MAARAFMEARFGADFSPVSVSVDADERAADAAAIRTLRDTMLPSKGVGSLAVGPSMARDRREGLVVPAVVAHVLSTPGRPLEGPARAYFEPRFAHDFSGVRVHADATAADSARAVGAAAYTVGQHIVFGRSQYDPWTPAGRGLLAHELTHVVQQNTRTGTWLQRSVAGCQELLSRANVLSLLSGSLVHRIIGAHFQRTVRGAMAIAIPGASAGPLRSAGICGGPDPVIGPQIVGGASGAGIPDLAQLNPRGVLQVAEIKPAALPCLVDGEEQLLRYIDQGNAGDAAQSAWRASKRISVVAPMLESTYPPPSFQVSAPGLGTAQLKTAWCTSGLMAYTVEASAQPIPVPVPAGRRVEERESLRRQAPRRVPTPIVVAGAAVAAVAGRALWRHFWRVVIQRFAIRGAAALALSLADGPLPFGEIVSLGLAVVTVAQIINDWNEIWREADRVAAEGA